jgi:hypothetical protein
MMTIERRDELAKRCIDGEDIEQINASMSPAEKLECIGRFNHAMSADIRITVSVKPFGSPQYFVVCQDAGLYVYEETRDAFLDEVGDHLRRLAEYRDSKLEERRALLPATVKRMNETLVRRARIALRRFDETLTFLRKVRDNSRKKELAKSNE